MSGHTALTQLESADVVHDVNYPDFSDVKAQSMPKRALEIAAAGGHSVIMSGPPGTGKSMLASCFVGILPEMTEPEALDSAAIQSLNGNYKLENWKRRPYREPHHTASAVALVGGGCDLSKLVRHFRNRCDKLFKSIKLLSTTPFLFKQEWRFLLSK